MNERDLRDAKLTRALNVAYGATPVPESLTRDALAIPRQVEAPLIAPPRVLPVILPHLAGVLVLVGVAIGFLTRPDLMTSVGSALGTLSSQIEASPWVMVAAVLPPLAAAFALEASRGFRDLERLAR